jgi:hypothetical protein
MSQAVTAPRRPVTGIEPISDEVNNRPPHAVRRMLKMISAMMPVAAASTRRSGTA